MHLLRPRSRKYQLVPESLESRLVLAAGSLSSWANVMRFQSDAAPPAGGVVFTKTIPLSAIGGSTSGTVVITQNFPMAPLGEPLDATSSGTVVVSQTFPIYWNGPSQVMGEYVVSQTIDLQALGPGSSGVVTINQTIPFVSADGTPIAKAVEFTMTIPLVTQDGPTDGLSLGGVVITQTIPLGPEGGLSTGSVVVTQSLPMHPFQPGVPEAARERPPASTPAENVAMRRFPTVAPAAEGRPASPLRAIRPSAAGSFRPVRER